MKTSFSRNLKTLLVCTAIVTILSSCDRSPVEWSKPQVIHPTDIQEGCTTFTVQNLSTKFSGTVTVTDGATSIYIPAPTSGSFNGTVCFSPLSGVVNSVNCPYPQTKIVTLPTGDSLSIQWSNSDAIAILDYGQQN